MDDVERGDQKSGVFFEANGNQSERKAMGYPRFRNHPSIHIAILRCCKHRVFLTEKESLWSDI